MDLSWVTGSPFTDITEHINELRDSLSSFEPSYIIGGNGVGLTVNTFWLIICAILTMVVVCVGARKVRYDGGGKFAGLVEWGYDAIRRNMGEGAIGHGYQKHMPFLATLFFFILISNIVGLIPGCKTPCGSLSMTWALSAISFVYFNYYGIKAKGGWGYIKAIAPSGLPKPMVPIIWFFEFVSLVIRLLTLAVRLYGNMFAGHMVLGVFGVLTSTFILEAVSGFGAITALPSVIWMVFLIFMYAMECLIAFLQAYVFTILSAVYIGLATSSH